MKTVGKVKEPLHGYTQEIGSISVNQLKVIEIQRGPSKAHIKRLVNSIKKIGFVIPLIVVRRGEENIIIDGQHRFLAAKELGIRELPVIVMPDKYSLNLMELNVEKQMSLRERTHVSLNVYRMYLDESPIMSEDDGRIMDSIEFAYYVTLGLAYEKKPRIFGSAYESILKKIDGFLSVQLMDALKEREKRAGTIVESDNLARETIAKIKELGIDHPFLYNQVISSCTPMKRKRKVKQTFEALFEALQKNLKELAANPGKIRSRGISAGY